MPKNKQQIITKSLDNIGEYFPDIKSACIDGYFQIDSNRLTSTEEIVRCIHIYTMLKNIKGLSSRKLDVLVFYLKYGYSKEIKKLIEERLKIKEGNLNSINCELRKLGVIEQVGHNESNNKVCDELREFKEFIVDQKGSYILISINERGI